MTVSSTGASVSFKGVSKTYGTYCAVEDVNLDIAPGEFVSLLGPSGSGKSTTLMMLAGFETPTAGSIFLSGQDITGLPPYRRNIGMVYQNYALFPHMTVRDNIGFPLRMRGIPRDTARVMIDEALEMVQLKAFAVRYPHQMSGGQQQRVAIARALVFKPPLVLMDEPLGALDKKLREELQVEIKRIQQLTRSTILYVTHDQDEALSMSDRVVVMNHARIEHAGSPTEVYVRPRTRFVADFLGSANIFAGEVRKSAKGHLFHTPNGLCFPIAASTATNDVHAVLRPERIVVMPEDGAEGHRGTVASITYKGHSEWILADLDSGERIMASRIAGGGGVKEGDRVRLAWSQDALHLVA